MKNLVFYGKEKKELGNCCKICLLIKNRIWVSRINLWCIGKVFSVGDYKEDKKIVGLKTV